MTNSLRVLRLKLTNRNKTVTSEHDVETITEAQRDASHQGVEISSLTGRPNDLFQYDILGDAESYFVEGVPR